MTTAEQRIAFMFECLKCPATWIGAETVSDLLEPGANPDVTDTDGLTPLLLLLQRPPVPADRPFDRPRIQRENMALVVLLRAGARLDVRTREGATVLDLAAARDDDGVAYKMLTREMYRRSQPLLMNTVSHIPPSWPLPGDVNLKDIKRDLFALCVTSSYEYRKHALAHDSYVESLYNKPLHPLIHEKAAYFLHLYPALIESRDAAGYTPLQRCFADGVTDCVPTLLMAGANFQACDFTGRSLRDIIEHQHADTTPTAYLRQGLLIALETFEDIQAVVKKYQTTAAQTAKPPAQPQGRHP